MDEHNELRTRLRTVGMELFRRTGCALRCSRPLR